MDKTTNIDEYIALFSKDIQSKHQELREFIQQTVPETTEAISYQMPTFDLSGKHLVYFAAFTNHTGFYPFPSGIEAFKSETTGNQTSAHAIQFPYNRSISFDLIMKIVLYRAKEHTEKRVEANFY